jgi:hypothetical protein
MNSKSRVERHITNLIWPTDILTRTPDSDCQWGFGILLETGGYQMTYYEHATAMAFKLDRWAEGRKLRNFELEAQAAELRTSAIFVKKPSILRSCISAFRDRKSSKTADAPKAPLP